MFQSQSCCLTALTQHMGFSLGHFHDMNTFFLLLVFDDHQLFLFWVYVWTQLQSCCSNTMQFTYIVACIVQGVNQPVTIYMLICTDFGLEGTNSVRIFFKLKIFSHGWVTLYCKIHHKFQRTSFKVWSGSHLFRKSSWHFLTKAWTDNNPDSAHTVSLGVCVLTPRSSLMDPMYAVHAS